MTDTPDARWPKMGKVNIPDTTPPQQILTLRDEIERISKYLTQNPKRKASASYNRTLSSRTLSIIEQLVGQASLTSLDDQVARITDLVIGIGHKVSYTQLIAQGIRGQRPEVG